MVTDVESSYSLLRNISSSFRKTFVKYLSFAIDPGNKKGQFKLQIYSSVDVHCSSPCETKNTHNFLVVL